jgi:quinol monooxygenase YgiN
LHIGVTGVPGETGFPTPGVTDGTIVRVVAMRIIATGKGGSAMKADIYWLCTFRVKPEDFPAFKAVVAPLVAETRKEDGSMAYEYHVTDDHSMIHILEHYRDSAAVVHHVTQTFSRFAEAFTALASVESFVVYGTPEPEARQILDGFGAVYVPPFDGFTK